MTNSDYNSIDNKPEPYSDIIEHLEQIHTFENPMQKLE